MVLTVSECCGGGRGKSRLLFQHTFFFLDPSHPTSEPFTLTCPSRSSACFSPRRCAASRASSAAAAARCAATSASASARAAHAPAARA